MTALVTDTEHYTKVLNLAAMAKRTLWLGTADIKDLYVSQGGEQKPFLGILSAMLGRGVEVRLIHAKEPGPNFRADFDRYPRLAARLERVLCPRVHFKIVVIDQTVCYIGSANLTGAGMGMKAAGRRNFEAGILTDDPKIVEAAIEEFDKVWRGSECKKCQRRQFCSDPIG
ncbi:MAG: phospholipase D family protein [Salinivirgaceae bacterium]|nr:phospholipase D family protein [Salinivirgaceae bacterium]